MKKIHLSNLSPIIAPAITEVTARCMQEACEVSLQCNNHKPGVEMKVQGKFEDRVLINWIYNTDDAEVKWDPNQASEWGASCIALMLVPEFTGFFANDRAFSCDGLGFDYWLGSESMNKTADIFNTKDHKARLEVSGIRKGSQTDINARVKRKTNQVSPSDYLELPAYIIVVEFGTPISKTVVKTP